ncbi:MAG: TrkH family potassium uptake protein [Deltaproteobacteria bacterium]|nr:TrkH family potassium uptake protein [Deltaproteobacteria bacterium]
MQIRAIVHIIGVLMVGLAFAMFLSSLVAAAYQEEDLFSMIVAGVTTMVVGMAMFFGSGRPTEKMEVSHRSAFAIVTFGWLAACILGALPYFFYAQFPAFINSDAPLNAAGEIERNSELLTHKADCAEDTGLGREFCSFTNSVFESTSGFTTTGATILEAGLWASPDSRRGGLPHGLLFWRAVTHFLGGMGIIVFGVALLPLLGVGGMQLFKAEVPGPVKDKMAPRVAETARLLWKVYAGLTIVQFLLLLATGQGPFLSICHAFATMATGGFSPLASSIETLQSPASEWIIALFMLLAGANFSLHFNSLRRRRLVHWRDSEFRFYFGVVAVISVVLALVLWIENKNGPLEATRASVFQILSVMTTTGFSSTDFNLWGVGAKMLLLSTFFIGGCAGSTGGGIKCVRVFLMGKLAITELKRLVHPHGVIQSRLGGGVVPISVVNSVAGFIALYLGVYLISVVLFALMDYDLITSITVVGATLGNIGPGLGDVGPAANYNFFESGLKWHQIFLMIIGRLEIYSVLIVLTPEFWRK